MPPSRSNRACDACKRRKVKCDGGTVCGHCRVAKTACTWDVVPKKRGPKPILERQPRQLRDDHEINSASSPAVPGPAVFATSDFTHRNNAIPHQFSDATPTSYTESLGVSPSTTSPSSSRSARATQALTIKKRLLTRLHSVSPETQIWHIVDRCISLYFQLAFPALPICHEPSLRRAAASLFDPLSEVSAPRLLDDPAQSHCLATLRAFTLVAALCAFAIFIFEPAGISLCDVTAGEAFLSASRDMLHLYEDEDVEVPDSTSFSIRMFISSALRNMTGRPRLSNYYFGQACLLALNLRLYDESSLSDYHPLEAQLLRHNFWLVWISDQSAASFGTRPFIVSAPVLTSSLTLKMRNEQPIRLLDPENPPNHLDFETELLEGFHFSCRMRTLAAELIQEAKCFGDPTKHHVRCEKHETERFKQLSENFVAFCCILEEMPAQLRVIRKRTSSPELLGTNDTGNPDDSDYQAAAFSVHGAYLLISFHSLRLIIVYHCAKNGLAEAIGICHEPINVSLKIVEIGRDLVNLLEQIEFQYIQLMGELNVELLRCVGSVLLELVQNDTHSIIKERANLFITRVLDVLSKLNSKSTDELLLQYA